MAERNKYLNTQVPFFYQRQTLDVMIFTYIRLYRELFPSVTLKEAAVAFMREHSIADELYSLDSVITAYERTTKDYYDAQKKR